MKSTGKSPSLWKRKDEGFGSVFVKLLFLILVYGLVALMFIEKTEGGTDWIFARFPILNVVRDVSPIGLYIFWLFSLWLGFKIGKQLGMKRGAARERKKLGIPY